MAEQLENAQDNAITLARALSLPMFALFFALLLIYTSRSPADSHAVVWITFPETLGGDNLRYGLRNIAIVFGLSSLPGGLIGAMLGYLITQNSKLASVSISLLRIGQWAPFVIWWVLVILLFGATLQQRSGYFFIGTMAIPAVALANCYHLLCTIHLLRLDWRRSVSESMGFACHRALFISLILALSVWSENWVPFPLNYIVINYYAVALVLALCLMAINWIYRSGIERSAKLHREIILADLNRRNDSSTWLATLIILFTVAVWHLFGLIGNFSVTPVRVFNAAVMLFSEAEIWQDIRISLLEIFAGVIFSGALTFIVSAILLVDRSIRKWALSILSLTFAIPMVTLPAWLGSPLIQGGFTWHAVCVTGLSFYPLLHTVWSLHEEPQLCRISLAADHALPYAFAATLYGQMMMATAGLGFATIIASATHQTEKAFALFLITLSLLYVLSTTLRLVAKRFLPARIPGERTSLYDFS